ncbi:two-component regulator propeller domain-containing protein [Rhodocytophaga aerolata]|uniref:Two-component regulator propeller domain-containing protein n=1 Tax=Rhodocytophaga aerolata TaxID=455078 RepID=A0ABT8RHE9_9BACT|nr:sensor histidine kinase [Rhodocytophaga aerolata]MDO1450804.1 two-component regulator propeller domain-containing protein [Rhodocytophaga aerolata]
MPPRQAILLILRLVIVVMAMGHAATVSAQESAYTYMHLDQEDGLASNDVLSILQDRKGFLWVGTNNGLQRYDGRQFIHFRHNPYSPNSLASDIIESLFEDSRGTLWIASAHTVTQLNPQTHQFTRIRVPKYTQEEASARRYFVEDEKKQIWLLTGKGKQAFVYKADQQAFVTLPQTPTFPNPDSAYASLLAPWKSREAYVYLNDSRGIFWAGSEKLLARYPGTAGFEMIPAQPASRYGIDYNRIFALAEDREGTVWVGTDKGMYYFNPGKQRFFSVTIPSSTATPSEGIIPTDFIRTQQGELWVSTLNGGMLRYDSQFKPVTRPVRTANVALPLWCLVQDTNGTVWAGSQEGTLVALEQDGRISYIHPPALAGQTIREAVLDASGILWLGSEQGQVFTFNPLTHKVTRLPLDQLSHTLGRVLRILPQQAAYVWIATSAGGVFKLHKQTATVVEHYHTSSKPYALLSNQVGDMQWVDSTTLAVSTIAGLHLLNTTHKTGTTFTTSEGLPANALINVIPVKNGDFYVTPQNGLSRWNPQTHRLTTFSSRDGLSNTPFLFNASYRLPDGRIVLGTMNGFFYFHPDSLQDHTPPADVLITGVKVMDKPIRLDSAMAKDSSLRLGYKENFFTIEFASLSYYDDKQISYFYQLEGIDQEWVRAGVNRFANYTNIEGGSYRFKVKAQRNDGMSTLHESTLAIHVAQPFWKTWWFRGLVILGLAGVGIGIYRIRIDRMLALQNMRVQISRDLHDDMGSTLSTITILSAMARQQMGKNTGQTEGHLEKISEYAQRMMETMDDIVWSVNPLNDAAQNLVARMRSFCAETLEPKGIPFTLEVEEGASSLRLPLALKHNCFMIFKEAVNNAGKYARCQSIRVCLNIQKKQLLLEIRDDGEGFDKNQVSQGNGLLNMQARATAIHGNLQIVSAKGSGTTITLKAPVNG